MVPRQAVTSSKLAIQIDPGVIPEADVAVQQFQSAGGQLTIFNTFGEDPLQSNPALVAQCEREFFCCYTDFSRFFHTVVNGDYTLFREGVLCFIGISRRLFAQLVIFDDNKINS